MFNDMEIEDTKLSMNFESQESPEELIIPPLPVQISPDQFLIYKKDGEFDKSQGWMHMSLVECLYREANPDFHDRVFKKVTKEVFKEITKEDGSFELDENGNVIFEAVLENVIEVNQTLNLIQEAIKMQAKEGYEIEIINADELIPLIMTEEEILQLSQTM